MRNRTKTKLSPVEQAEVELAEVNARLEAARLAEADEAKAEARVQAETDAAEVLAALGSTLGACRARLVAAATAVQDGLVELRESAAEYQQHVTDAVRELDRRGLRLEGENKDHANGSWPRVALLDGVRHRVVDVDELAAFLGRRVLVEWAGRPRSMGVSSVVDEVPAPPPKAPRQATPTYQTNPSHVVPASYADHFAEGRRQAGADAR